MSYNTIRLFDLDFISAENHADFFDDLMDYRNNPDYGHKKPFVITPNADQVVKLDQPQHHTLKKQISQSLFILPDGQPIILFSKLARKPLKNRLTGSDLFPLLWQAAQKNRQRILVIVSEEAIGVKLKQDYDNIMYYTPPFFSVDSPLFDKVCLENFKIIKDFKPEYVIIGLGFPKQEFLGLALYQKLKEDNIPNPLFLFLGASADFYVGTKKRAPLLLQKMGLEWLHRLVSEPKVKWRRYILGIGPLFMLYMKELRKEFSKKKPSI
jgi:N-acetylglucosaminyldiphosphoundecaprenol N-acetyl-beta-D-mannosaminyltransferase